MNAAKEAAKLEEMNKKTVSFAGEEAPPPAAPPPAGAPLSKKEQYRQAVLKAEQGETGINSDLNDAAFRAISDAKMGGVTQLDAYYVKEAVTQKQDEALQFQGSVSHAGVLRKKNEMHGRFENAYKTVCVATLERGVITLKVTQNGELVGSEESYDLSAGWKLMGKETPDKFVLTRAGAGGEEQVALKAESKAEGQVWLEKLKETAQWLAERR
eukprot:CAMPEP_0177734284 /NCGR_PEP_ID=MMETSP0484_2-20121128/24147_1 /TAXON_ID=354590 /ORGANISM="Rhodomonas lens, Strain RHODO" /LENGTH=212 /DNA_ID=CAMNT_0019247743 /DNA_START=30 /DNA_END=664 /DNA_ORIENTATION=-